MKIRIKSMLKAVCLATVLGACSSAMAVNIELQVGLLDPRSVGDVINNIGGGGSQQSREMAMVNNLITVPVGTSQRIPAITGELYERSAHNFGVLPTAVALNAVTTAVGDINFQGNNVLITIGTGYFYLIAAYDGPNGGAQVWNISGFAAGTTFEIPRYAAPAVDGDPDQGPLVEGEKYQMTGWSLFNPGTTTRVPEGGATIVLLGAAVTLLGAGRRFLKF